MRASAVPLMGVLLLCVMGPMCIQNTPIPFVEKLRIEFDQLCRLGEFGHRLAGKLYGMIRRVI